jgi:hypothetical protein
MNWPKEMTINIIGSVWTVKRIDHPMVDDEGSEIYGQIDPDSLTILVSSKNDPAKHLWHEIKHVIGRALCVDTESKGDAHDLTERMAQAEVAVMRANPDLLDEIEGPINES